MGEIAREGEDEARHLPFALAEVVDRVLAGRSAVGLVDDVELEEALIDHAPTHLDLSLDGLEPDTLEVRVLQNVQDGVHVVVERLDRVGFDGRRTRVR
jgi:hypothetical protein